MYGRRMGSPSRRSATAVGYLVSGEAEEFVSLSDLAAPARAFPARDPADVALFQLSGGSTGTPKRSVFDAVVAHKGGAPAP